MRAILLGLAIASLASFSLIPFALAQSAPAKIEVKQDKSANSGGNSALASKIEKLEEQLVNLQSTIAALESLAKNPRNNNEIISTPPNISNQANIVSAAQLRQLSEQIAEITQRIERLEARVNVSIALVEQAKNRDSFNTTPASGFEDKQALADISSGKIAAPGGSNPAAGALVEPAVVINGASNGDNPQILFDQASNALNRRDYNSAERDFKLFLEKYPNETKSGSATYWLGEISFTNGEYKMAADRYLKSFTQHPKGEYSAEALFKLAVALRHLGEKSAACDSLSEFAKRFPQPPKNIAKHLETEKKLANCS